MQQKQDPHGPNLALFVGNLPTNLSQLQYEKKLTDFLGNGKQHPLVLHMLYNSLCDLYRIPPFCLLLMNTTIFSTQMPQFVSQEPCNFYSDGTWWTIV